MIGVSTTATANETRNIGKYDFNKELGERTSVSLKANMVIG
jgi:hypothetical protein